MGRSAVALGAKGEARAEGLTWTPAKYRTALWLEELDETLLRGTWSSESAGRWVGRQRAASRWVVRPVVKCTISVLQSAQQVYYKCTTM